eukprot:11062069-Prorocentrum_lima.AAC.1
MTSSLVGSEMCIRDSHNGTDAESCAGGAFNHKKTVVGVSATCCSTQAVSYTHLTLPTICSV